MAKYIKNLHASVIGKFEEVNVIFNPHFNFIVGANGCGKTTLLKIIAIILNPGYASSLRYGYNSELWIDCVEDERIIRVGLGKGWVSQWDVYRHASYTHYSKPPSDIEVGESYIISEIERSGYVLAPLFLGAYRRINYQLINGMRRENSPQERRTNYIREAMNSIEGGHLPEVKQWMINRYFLIDKDWAGDLKKNWVRIIDNLKFISPFYEQFSFKEIKQDLEPVFILNGKECYLEELSAGFQAVLSLIFGIVDWIEAINEPDNILIQNAKGTVVIDELDVHLHPEWQLMIRYALDKLFPNLQFIITTHSPHLIASAKRGEIIKIPFDQDRINVEAVNQSYSGWSTEEILEDVMEVKGLSTKELSIAMKEAMDAVEEKRIEHLKECIEKLKFIVHPNNIILEVLQIKLAELLLENNDDTH